MEYIFKISKKRIRMCYSYITVSKIVSKVCTGKKWELDYDTT